MIKSMTGFGTGESSGSFGSIRVDIKTVNYRYFDISSKLPNGLFVLEDNIREYIQKYIRRGRVHLSVMHEDAVHKNKKVNINRELAGALLSETRKLKKSIGLSGQIDVNQILSFPGVVSYYEPPVGKRRLWICVKRALKEALDNLDASRCREGRELAKDLRLRINEIKKNTDAIKKRTTANTRHYKKELSRRIKELSGGVEMDKGRLEQEVAIYAKNSDITEEIIRIKSHVKHFGKIVKGDGEVGKTLDFIAQELIREANTIASKSGDYQISSHVIGIKSEIEKIREQVKNVE